MRDHPNGRRGVEQLPLFKAEKLLRLPKPLWGAKGITRNAGVTVCPPGGSMELAGRSPLYLCPLEKSIAESIVFSVCAWLSMD
ncbi:MAG: hypothetical protein GY922_00770 [Proteobacteria bacterium]|nr:hypothetical protein [Pseudomonadota bacterium]